MNHFTDIAGATLGSELFGVAPQQLREFGGVVGNQPSSKGNSVRSADINRVTGMFLAGEPVDICGPDGVVFARGLVTYDSAELPELLGRNTKELAAERGASYEREVIHRDDLVLLDP